MDTQLKVRRAELDEFPVVGPVFAEASADEEVCRWIVRDHPDIAELYRTQHAPAMLEQALHEDEVWIAESGDEIWAVSIWQTVRDHQRLDRAVAETRAMYEQAPVPPMRRLRALTTLLAQTHPTDQPHRYLQVIATLPQHRGKGAGAAIVTERAKAAADAGLPAYLEASTERSARLYARCGFDLEGDLIQLPEDGPLLRPMWFRG
ncbi:GNAT family N-acetyltransferase [Nocardia sp. NPDC048505]|uniref:GNAT family N-acetyltransferase n=1 Tax=unclassified Nocardia TaxID=2637762 RepID=UPI0033BFEDBF